jgi:hypothetical protein
MIWQDAAGKTYLSYNDLAFIIRWRDIGEAARPLIAAMSGAPKELVKKPTTARRDQHERAGQDRTTN